MKIETVLELMSFQGKVATASQKEKERLSTIFGELGKDPRIDHSEIKSLRQQMISASSPEEANSSFEEIFRFAISGLTDEQIYDLLRLNEWKANARGNVDEACTRIIECFKKGSKKLNLTNLELNSLPACIGNLRKLETLYLAQNHLSSLSLSLFDNLSNLVELDLSDNRLESLPPLDNLSRLIELYISNNRLESLPSLDNLTELKFLRANNNLLISLPSSFLDNLTKLECLNLSNNQLLSLPSLNNLTQLTLLEVENNRLTSLPSLSNLARLRSLVAGNNELEYLPSLDSLTELRYIYVGANQLTLPPDVSRLRNIIRLSWEGNPGFYAQSAIDIQISHFQAATSEQDLKNLDIGILMEDPEAAGYLNTWVPLLTISKDFNTDNLVLREMFAIRVLGILKHAIEDPKYRKALKWITEQAQASCVDRANLGLNDAEVESTMRKASGKPLKEVVRIFEEAFMKKQLEQIADEKIAVLLSQGKKVDEIEVHLAYQVMLKDRLSLTFGSREMQFAILSHVTQEDLDEAEKKVRQALCDREKFSGFLIKNKHWIAFLEKEYFSVRERAIGRELKEIERKMSELDDRMGEMQEWEYKKASDELQKDKKDLETAWFKRKTEEVLRNVA